VRFRTTNWQEYNAALQSCGSLTIWLDPQMHWGATPSGRRRRQPVFSDTAIQTCLTMKVLIGIALRQATGFVESLLQLIGLRWLMERQRDIAENAPRAHVHAARLDAWMLGLDAI
jgi:hypothetical protein